MRQPQLMIRRTQLRQERKKGGKSLTPNLHRHIFKLYVYVPGDTGINLRRQIAMTWPRAELEMCPDWRYVD
jgi:hypothetical protein